MFKYPTVEELAIEVNILSQALVDPTKIEPVMLQVTEEGWVLTFWEFSDNLTLITAKIATDNITGKMAKEECYTKAQELLKKIFPLKIANTIKKNRSPILSKMIHLAYTKPEYQKKLLPIIKKAEAQKTPELEEFVDVLEQGQHKLAPIFKEYYTTGKTPESMTGSEFRTLLDSTLDKFRKMKEQE
jgi:hypothetical protein